VANTFPDHLEDGILNRAQIASALGVSENTITEWISRGFPVLEHGGNGRAYQFQLSACWIWARNYQEGEITARADADRITRAAAAEFLNLGDEVTAPGLSPGEHRKLLEAELLQMQVNERRGDLVRVNRLSHSLADVFASVQRAFTTLPDYAELELGLEPAEVQKMQDKCDQSLIDLRLQIEAAIGPLVDPVSLPLAPYTKGA
jgi:phage terminase Nu1 subunit (DNA packaging protein)